MAAPENLQESVFLYEEFIPWPKYDTSQIRFKNRD